MRCKNIILILNYKTCIKLFKNKHNITEQVNKKGIEHLRSKIEKLKMEVR